MNENKKETYWDLPDFVIDSGNGTKFKRSVFLGKGAFGKCFELINTETGDVYAGKIVSKQILRKTRMKEKMVQEISIHKNLKHKHVVSFQRFFEDESYIYIILELCRRRSMAELHKRRQCLTDPEVRYYMKQIISAVQYLHDNNIVHRDLKLGNIFINDSMEVKIGDFGLSTYIENGERKKTMCGTPNYIAPEILEKKGHGFEVDIWSIGCIIFTLLIGKPPFETSSIKETYSRILRCDYCVPMEINKYAEKTIRRIFVKNPDYRPKANELLHEQFFSNGYTPPCLPTSCLVMAPKFSITDKSLSKKRKPLSELNVCSIFVSPERSKLTTSIIDGASKKISGEKYPFPLGNKYLKMLQEQLTGVLNSNPSDREVANIEDIEDPAAHPIIWISSWVDYSDKYGFAYKLNDGSIGVVFIDRTKIVLLSNGINVQYTNKNGSESYFKINEFDPALKKKMRLLKLFQEYMGHLMKTGSRIPAEHSESDKFIRVPVLGDWIRYDRAIVMLLSNGTLQVNFFPDHSKIILCPLMGAITFIDKDEVFHTYRLKLIKEYGCSKMLEWRIQYTLRKISHMISECSNK